MHPLPNNQLLPALLPPPEFSPPPDDMYLDDGENDPGPHEAIEGGGGVQTLRHPILNGMSFIHTFLYYIQDTLLGMPCDSLGNYLPPDTLPPPHILPGEDGAGAHNAWDPFHNRAQFEIADFLYR